MGPEYDYWNAFLFRFPETLFPKVVRIVTKLYHKIELIRAISTVLFPPSYLFWNARYGTCRVFVYLFYPDGADDSEHAVGKIFQWEFSAIEIMEIGSIVMEKTRN